jgi:hypothetical protein
MAVTGANEIDPWGNVMFPAVSTVPVAVAVMPVIVIGNVDAPIVNDPANATWIGPALLTVAPAGLALSSPVPAVKAREDPTIAATVTNRLSLKRRIYVPFLNSVLVDGISTGDWIVSYEEYNDGSCGHGRSTSGHAEVHLVAGGRHVLTVRPPKTLHPNCFSHLSPLSERASTGRAKTSELFALRDVTACGRATTLS